MDRVVEDIMDLRTCPTTRNDVSRQMESFEKHFDFLADLSFYRFNIIRTIERLKTYLNRKDSKRADEANLLASFRGSAITPLFGLNHQCLVVITEFELDMKTRDYEELILKSKDVETKLLNESRKK
eukprot:272142_1